MSKFAVTAIGRDRPGIVAAITGVLFDLGGNVEDSRMSILRGHFAVMLIVELPAGAERERLDSGLAEVRERLGLEAVSVSEVEDVKPADDGGASHVLTVYGADHPGIVHRVANVVAQSGANVTDLSTQVAGSSPPVYVMVIELAVPEGTEASLDESLSAAAGELEVDISLRPLAGEAL